MQAALLMDALGGHGARANAELEPGWQLGLLRGLRAGLADGLVKQVFKDGAALLEAGGRDVGQIVGNHVELGLLGVESRAGDMQ